MMQYLNKESPECFSTNPNKLQIVLGTIMAIAILHPTILKTSFSLYMKKLPLDKFPKDSQGRSDKAQMLSERVYKLVIYSITTAILYWILKESSSLHVSLGGTDASPKYFENFPC